MDRDISTNNYWFRSVQAQKIALLQIILSEEETCDQNGKPANPRYPQPIVIISIAY